MLLNEYIQKLKPFLSFLHKNEFQQKLGFENKNKYFYVIFAFFHLLILKIFFTEICMKNIYIYNLFAIISYDTEKYIIIMSQL